MRRISDACSQSVENQNRDLGLNRKAPSLFCSRASISTFRAAVCFILALMLAWPAPVRAYAVLSHEAIINAVWETHIKPLLLKKFPHSTDEQLSEALAYAYGGAIIQDMGYYPYGSPFFSDLTHYIRSDDFIQALLHDAKDIDEYAFSLGALAHYAADNDGHRIGINRAVPILYPRLGKKFGNSVSFEDDKLAHVKTEFGFDVLEVARSLLEQSFKETYGLELKDVLLRPWENYLWPLLRHPIS
jgi:hypothetical protein